MVLLFGMVVFALAVDIEAILCNMKCLRDKKIQTEKN